MREAAIIIAIFASLLGLLAWSDQQCEVRGGTIVVVSERQAKGIMNHTECK